MNAEQRTFERGRVSRYIDPDYTYTRVGLWPSFILVFIFVLFLVFYFFFLFVEEPNLDVDSLAILT